MSEAKFTPGPWERQAIDRDGPDYGVAIVGGNLGGLVGAALPWPTEIDSGDMDRVEANAHLIAAAPDLYEALCAMILMHDAGGVTLGAALDARRALAKARGEPA